MATIYDGVPVFAPAAGNTALAADQVTFQAKMILGMEERQQQIPLASGRVGDAAGWSLDWTIAAAPDLKWTNAGANAEILFPVSLRAKEYIVRTDAWVSSGNGNPTGGSIVLYAQKNDGTMASVSAFGCAGNFWDTDTAIDANSDIGPAYTADGDYNFFVGVQAAAVMDGVTHTLYGLSVTTRFHLGT